MCLQAHPRARIAAVHVPALLIQEGRVEAARVLPQGRAQQQARKHVGDMAEQRRGNVHAPTPLEHVLSQLRAKWERCVCQETWTRICQRGLGVRSGATSKREASALSVRPAGSHPRFGLCAREEHKDRLLQTLPEATVTTWMNVLGCWFVSCGLRLCAATGRTGLCAHSVSTTDVTLSGTY